MQVSGIGTTVGVTSIPSLTEVGGGNSVSAPPASGGFASMVGDLIGRVQGDQQQADAALVQLTDGNIDNVQQVVMSVAKADLSFRFFLEMRNKLTESYQELSRMQF